MLNLDSEFTVSFLGISVCSLSGYHSLEDVKKVMINPRKNKVQISFNYPSLCLATQQKPHTQIWRLPLYLYIYITSGD
jgi:hypothetical protein